MKKCYINGTGCISAQKTFDTPFLEDVVVDTENNVLPVQAPDYKEFVAPAMARRMARVVKNGVAASTRALQEAGVANPDAIITGTGLGCNTDSEKFLTAILDNKEEFLTPTSFIQSTHNTVGAQIALGLQCKAYNFTYVNGSISFESCLIDAQLQIAEGEAGDILVGGMEEWADNTIAFMHMAGVTKTEDAKPYSVLEAGSKGAVLSEGAVFFSLSDKKQESTYAELKDVAVYNRLGENDLTGKVENFLKNNGITVADIDVVVLGYNGDSDFDGYYNTLAKGIFAQTPQMYYKHLSGEFNTASAFGMWVAAKAIKAQHFPDVLKANGLEKPSYKNVLLYNQYRGQDHSFVLLTACS